MCAAVAYPISQQRFWRPYLVDGMEPQPRARAAGATQLQPGVERVRPLSSKTRQPLGFGSITDQERQAYLNDPATKGVIPLQIDGRSPISPFAHPAPVSRKQRPSLRSSSKAKGRSTSGPKAPPVAQTVIEPASSPGEAWTKEGERSNGGQQEPHEVHEFYCFARNQTIQYFTPPRKKYEQTEANRTPDEELRKLIMGGFEQKSSDSWKHGIFHHLYDDTCFRSRRPTVVPPVQESSPPSPSAQNSGFAPGCSSGNGQAANEPVVEAKRRRTRSPADPAPAESTEVRPREEQQQQKQVGPQVSEPKGRIDRFYFSENPGSYKIKTIWRVAHLREAEA